MNKNPIKWIEIPVEKIDRAVQFYNAVFDYDLQVNDLGHLQMAWLPNDLETGGASGSLVQHEAYLPSVEGPLVYFSCEDVEINLSRVENAGGEIIQKKTKISDEVGFMAVFLDSEGNRIALHSQK